MRLEIIIGSIIPLSIISIIVLAILEKEGNCTGGIIIGNYFVSIIPLSIAFFISLYGQDMSSKKAMIILVLILIAIYHIIIVHLWAINGCKDMRIRDTETNYQDFIETGEKKKEAFEFIISIVIFIIVYLGINELIIV